MKRTRQILGLVLALAGSLLTASEGEKPLPKELPPYGADRPIPPLNVAQHTLSNGLTVWLVKRPGFPKVTSYLVVRGGNASDPAGQQGLTGMMAQLLNEGTTSRTSRQIAEELQSIGGDLGSWAALDAVYLYGSSLSTGLPTLLDVLADVTQHPTFPAAEVALLKTNTLQGLQAQESMPNFQVNRAFNAAIFRGHPYRFAAIKPEVVQAATREAFIALHAQRFHPEQALLVLSGDFDEPRTLELVKADFGAWKRGAVELKPTPEAPQASVHAFLLLPRPGSVQSTLRVGRPTVPATHPDYIPLRLANVILGGSFDSRIVKNIREDKGYTYSPGGAAFAYQHGGVFYISAAVRTEVTAASLMEIFYEMDRMGTTTVGAPELQRAKRYMGGSYLFQNQMLQALTGTLATYWVNGQKPEALAEFVSKVNAVTAADIRRIGQTYFPSKDQTVVVVGDEAKARAEMEQFGPVTLLKPEGPSSKP